MAGARVAVDGEEGADVGERKREDGVLELDERGEAAGEGERRPCSRLHVPRALVAGGQLEPVGEGGLQDREAVAAPSRRARQVDDERRAREARRGRGRAARAASSSRASARIASAIPGASRSSTGRVASGVTSRGVNPVPPVVSTSELRAGQVDDRVRDLVGLVRDDAPLDVESLAREQLGERVAAPVLARARDGRRRRR